MTDPTKEERTKEVTGDTEDLGALTFEQLLARLEAVTSQLADGELGIEAAADLYERARLLHAAAGQRLAKVSARIADLGEAHPSITAG